MPAHLFIHTGPNSGEAHVIEGGDILVGRGMDCGVRLFDPHASRNHFRLERRGSSWWLVDLGSRNPTAVNGVPAGEKELHWGDEIRVGNTRLVFLSGGEPEGLGATYSQAVRQTQTITTSFGRYEMVGSSAAMQKVFAVIEKVAPLDVTVLVTGESGTGKELVANAIHRNSSRSEGALVVANCAAIPVGLIESELFGHEKGAFTGAAARRQGRFEAASGGTLFLDEIGELPAESQAKLLRVLEEKKVTRVGGTEAVDVDVRIVAATNRHLRADVEAGRFRQDLLFRLEVVSVEMPALRDRSGDMPELAEFFLERYRCKADRRLEGFSEQAMEKLISHNWPGNIRELKNVIERAAILGSGPEIGAEDILLPEAAVRKDGRFETLAEVERRHIERAMALAGGNKKKAAEMLGIPRSSLYDKLREYGLG